MLMVTLALMVAGCSLAADVTPPPAEEIAQTMVTATAEFESAVAVPLQETQPAQPSETSNPTETPAATHTAGATHTVTAIHTATNTPTNTVTPTSTTLPVISSTQTETSTQVQNINELAFGIGGLVLDLEKWADRDIAQFYKVSHIDISTLQFVSKFRSRAGHDYSGSFGSCSSNKHYFHPLNFYEVALSTPIYSAADGVFLYVQKETGTYAEDWKNNYAEVTGKQWPEDLKEYQLFFRPDEAPNLWIRYHHVTPIDEMLDDVIVVESNHMMMQRVRPKLPGFRVQAGDLIAHGLGEISIEQHLDGTGIPSPCTSAHIRSTRGNLPGCSATTRFLSIFNHMTDEVFAQYKQLADVERADFIISEEELKNNPYTCTGEFFDDKGNTPDADTYLLLQGTRSGSPSNLIDQSLSSIDDVGELIASFDGFGNGNYGPFDLSSGDIIVIKSDGGPLTTHINGNGESRQVYSRPAGDANVDYETLVPISGQIYIELTAPENVNWQVILVRTH